MTTRISTVTTPPTPLITTPSIRSTSVTPPFEQGFLSPFFIDLISQQAIRIISTKQKSGSHVFFHPSILPISQHQKQFSGPKKEKWGKANQQKPTKYTQSALEHYPTTPTTTIKMP
jgi:hypothetical protein